MKILIVDDEPGAAERLAAAVVAAGLGEGFAATNAEEAVAVVNAQDGVDVLATDVFMDGVDGFTLHETMRESLPDLRVIFLSEYDLSEHASRVGGWPVLARPIDDAALMAEIQRLLPEPAAAEPAPAFEAASLVGATLGAYRIDALAGEDLDGAIYAAVQTTIGRTVELHVLDPQRAIDPAEVTRFLGNARAKANVHHPALLSVFEAGESDGYYFYTSETRQGRSLWHLGQEGATLPPAALLQLLHTVAEAMVHLGQEHTAHEPLYAGHVIVDSRQRARLVNIATQESMGNTPREDMRALAAAITPVVPNHPSSGAIQQLIADMEAGAIPVRSWTALIYEVKRCLAAASSGATSYKIDAAERAQIEAVAKARRRAKGFRKFLVVFLILGTITAVAYYLMGGPIPPWKN